MVDLVVGPSSCEEYWIILLQYHFDVIVVLRIVTVDLEIHYYYCSRHVVLVENETKSLLSLQP